MNKGKILSIVSAVLWCLVIFHIFAYEVWSLNSILLTITGICSLVAVVILHVWFLVVYFKNHKKVLSLQDQYIETLKPEKPLRFCPTDEELMKKHMEKIHASKNTFEKSIEENTNEDSLESELE